MVCNHRTMNYAIEAHNQWQNPPRQVHSVSHPVQRVELFPSHNTLRWRRCLELRLPQSELIAELHLLITSWFISPPPESISHSDSHHNRTHKKTRNKVRVLKSSHCELTIKSICSLPLQVQAAVIYLVAKRIAPILTRQSAGYH